MSLGKVLRERRQELGKSLEQISAATRIHVRILSALEEDRYSELPARTFTRGFITSYCKTLRLDPERIFQEHRDFLEQKFTERQDRDQGHHGYVFEGKELEQNKRWMVIGASIALCFAVAVLLIFKPQNHKRKEKHKDFVAEDIASGSPSEDGETEEPATPVDPNLAPSPVLAKEVPGAATLAASGSPIGASSLASPAAIAASSSVSPTLTPLASITATPARPSATPQPTATPKPSPTPKTSVSPSPSPDAAKKDPLNKGDDLKPKEVKKKIAFEALDDAHVKYQADGRTSMEFTLHKGRFLVIKARESIVFETDKPEALRYRTKTREYQGLSKSRFSVEADGSLGDQ